MMPAPAPDHSAAIIIDSEDLFHLRIAALAWLKEHQDSSFAESIYDALKHTEPDSSDESATKV